MKKKYWILLGLVIIISLIISLTPVIYGIFPITYDQGRDFLWVKNQIDFQQPALVGPQASIRGMFFGPLWFWLLSLPYLISNGSPLVMTLFNGLIVYASVIFAALIFRKIDKKISYFIIFLGFISPAIQGIANYAFSEHLLPLLTILLLYSLAQILHQFSQKHFILACFWISLMFHAEPPISIFSIPALLLITFLASRRQKFVTVKTIFLAGLAFLLPFLPLLIFDLRHDFIQLKSLYSFLSGDTRGLQEIAPLTIWQRLMDRPEKLLISFQNTIFNTAKIIVVYVLVVLVDLTRRAKLKSFVVAFLNASLIYFLSLWIIFTLYPHEFKLFYLDGLKVIYLVWTAVGLSLLWQKVKSKKYFILF
ncbi:glycosyltransferase family 39 protein, partial [Patescibacteria group bacterium]|nr:glycosyltransferase family 39 protein [Patescibacteria group bacterium]